MQIIRVKRINISKRLSILRAFVDAIKVWKGDVFVSFTYRGGRAFCRYDDKFNLRYRLEENCLKKSGFGDFRCFTTDFAGNMLIAGSLRPDYITIFTIDEKGKIINSRYIRTFQMLESMAVDASNNLYMHSPFLKRPVYRYSPRDERPIGMGVFPPDSGSIERRIGKISFDNVGNLVIAFETSPPYIYRYDPEGREIFGKKLNSYDSIDGLTQILDMSIDHENGNIYLLRDKGKEKQKRVEIIDKDGGFIGEAEVPTGMRRICIAPGGILYSSQTRFGLDMMIRSVALYGALTTIDINRIQP